MSSTYYKIDPKEEKNRKNWLIVTVGLFGIYPILAFIFSVVLAKELQISEDSLYQIFANILYGLIGLWIIWHCAYKKHGTAWLTWCLIITPFRFLISTVLSLRESFDIGTLGVNALIIATFTWWYLLSLKLKKTNKKLQLQKHGSPEYFQAINTLKNAVTIESLDAQFHELMKNWPQFEPISSTEYKLKKSTFLQ